MFNTALISDDQKYRYYLTRDLTGNVFDTKPGSENRACLFIMLNPSTADARVNDPTIKRCMGFALDWGFHQLWVANLFAYRCTDPEVLKGSVNGVGEENDYWIERMALKADVVVAAWGNHGGLRNRDREVAKIPGTLEMRHLGLTKLNKPKHPLYLKADTQPQEFPVGVYSTPAPEAAPDAV